MKTNSSNLVTNGSGVNYISNFYKSFSGTDTLVFIIMPGSSPVVLGSITTLSYSMYRTKQPVINLGRTSINGLTRGARIYAGTMVFTMINQHWLRELQDSEQASWLSNYDELHADELPLFDLMIVSANEYGSYVSMFIYGVDITDEGQVISVNDLFTENTCSFVARDLLEFTAGETIVGSKSSSDGTEVDFQYSTISDIDWGIGNTNMKYEKNNNTTLHRSSNMKKKSASTSKKYRGSNMKYTNDGTPIVNKGSNMKKAIDDAVTSVGYTRMIKLNYHSPMSGLDVTNIQLALRELELLEYVTNIYDYATQEAVKKYQSENGINPTGVVELDTYISLMKKSEIYDNNVGVVVNKSGTAIYNKAGNNATTEANIVGYLSYGQTVHVLNLVQYDIPYYQINEGYVSGYDVYSSSYDTSTTSEYFTIKPGDTGYTVTILQNLINSIDSATIAKYFNGVSSLDYDEGTYYGDMVTFITNLQKDNNIAVASGYGIINTTTWMLLQSLATVHTINDINGNTTIMCNLMQGIYDLTFVDVTSATFTGLDVTAIGKAKSYIKATLYTTYSDGHDMTITKTYTVNTNASKTIQFSDFSEGYIYSYKYSCYPSKLEYVLYASTGETYKWTINVKEQ